MNIDTSMAMHHYNSANKITKSALKDDKALREQTDAFEAIMIKQLLDDSLKGENSMFPKQAGSEIYKSMYNDAVSKSVTGGFGFSQLLYDYLKENS